MPHPLHVDFYHSCTTRNREYSLQNYLSCYQDVSRLWIWYQYYIVQQFWQCPVMSAWGYIHYYTDILNHPSDDFYLNTYEYLNYSSLRIGHLSRGQCHWQLGRHSHHGLLPRNNDPVMIVRMCTLSYYHHQIGSVNNQPLFRVRLWNNGMSCMSYYVLMYILHHRLWIIGF